MHGGSPSPTGRPRETNPRYAQRVSQSPRGRKSMPNGSMTWGSPSANNPQLPSDQGHGVPATSQVGGGYPSELRHPAPQTVQEFSSKPSAGSLVGSRGTSGDMRYAMPATPQDAIRSSPGGYPMQHPSSASALTSYGGSAFASSRDSSAYATSMPPPDRGSTQSLVRCDTCGRSFHPESIDKHVRICEKVFNKKRRKFDSAATRLGDLDNANQLIKNAHKIEQEVKATSSTSSGTSKQKQKDNKDSKDSKDNKAMPKWKQQSLQFRQAILAAKGASGDVEAEHKAQKMQRHLQAVGADESPDMKKCPHCDRTFNKIAAERHIPICQKTFGSKPGGGRLLKGGGRVCAANATHTTTTSTCESARGSGSTEAPDRLQKTPPPGRNSLVPQGNAASNAMSRKSSATPSSAVRSRSGSVHNNSSGRTDASSYARPLLGAPQRMVR